MHQVRAMENKDLLAYKRLCSICYSYPDPGPADELPEEKLRIRRGVFDEQGNLLSAMMQIPYEVRFCNQTVPMLGIGGVVTDPTARRGGAIRAIFEADLPRQYREGQVLSSLYPFSYRFYGKFGYIWAQFGYRAVIPRGSFRENLARAEEIVRVLPDEDDQGMAAVYEQYAADKDFAVLRDASMWKQLRNGTPWEHLKHAYVLRMGGQPVAYWIGKIEKNGDGATLDMQDMAWTCNAGREAIFAMISGMNEVEEISVKCRSGFEPRLLCDEAWDVSPKETLQGMVRVINVERALAMLPAPVVPGTLILEVTDGQIQENCGKYLVASDGEKLTVTRVKDVEVDICCDIHGLTALVVGRHSFKDAADLGLVTWKGSPKSNFAALLFAEKKLHLNWNF